MSLLTCPFDSTQPRARRWLRSLVVASLMSACSSSPSALQPATSATPTKPLANDEPQGPPCVANALQALSAQQLEGIAAMAKGSPTAAEASFTEALRTNPADRVSAVLLSAARSDASEVRRLAGQQSSKLRPSSLPQATPAAPSARKKTFKMERLASSDPTEMQAFFAAKNLQVPSAFEPPSTIGPTLGEVGFSMAFQSNQALVARYQDSLLVVGNDEKGFRSLLLEPAIIAAFPEAAKPSGEATIFPEVSFATVVGSTLVAQLSHVGDANLPVDAFVVAYDLKTNKVKWVSERAVGNIAGPAVSADYFFTGFNGRGGSSVQVLELSTGKVVAEEPMASAISWLALDGETLHVWAPENVQLRIAKQSPAPAADYGDTVQLGDSLVPPLSAAASCHLENAAKALAVRDDSGLASAIQGLPRSSSAGRALQGALEFLRARKAGEKGIDLSEVAPKRAAYVAGTKTIESPASPAQKLKLVPTKSPVASQSPQMRAIISVHPEARSDLFPQTYGTNPIHGAFAFQNETLINYGNRFVARIEDGEVKSILDLAYLLKDPPAALDSQAVTFLGRIGDRLVTIVGSPTMMDNNGSYLAALDPRTGEVLWRTTEGLGNYNVLYFDEFVVALFQREEQAELVLIDSSTGKVIHTKPLSPPVTEISWDYQGAIYVTAKGERNFFLVK